MAGQAAEMIAEAKRLEREEAGKYTKEEWDAWGSLGEIYGGDGPTSCLTDQLPNIQFYCNVMPALPMKDNIENILRDRRGDYGWLESEHCYVQWLFPNKEASGVNRWAQGFESGKELDGGGAFLIAGSPTIRDRFARACRMMLEFYGIEVNIPECGIGGWSDDFSVRRGPEWAGRSSTLNLSSHNFLRITRILKAMPLFGFGELQGPLLEFFFTEIFTHHNVVNAGHSYKTYWLPCLADPSRQQVLGELLSTVWEKFESSIEVRRKLRGDGGALIVPMTEAQKQAKAAELEARRREREALLPQEEAEEADVAGLFDF